jgi:hypothetical protein
MSDRVFIVMLRTPERNDPRSDPFWEFGSFGCTGCHGKNMLHPKNCQVRDGDRLAFVQGGHLGPRLLLVTPPIKRIDHRAGSSSALVELCWDSSRKPFRYDRAPSVFESPSPGSRGLFPRLADSIADTNRATVGAKLASRFRSRSRPLEPDLAQELENGFDAAVKNAEESDFITCYEDALPWCDCPNSPDERRLNYERHLRGLKTVPSVPRCQPRRTGYRK